MKWLIDFFVRLFVNDFFVHAWKRFKHRFIEKRLNHSKGRFWKSRIPNMKKTARIHGDIVVSSPNNLVIEDHVRIGRNCFFACGGGLTIKENAQLSRNILIYTVNHDINADCIPYDTTNVKKPVVIGKSVWIGMNVTITPGVTIGDGAIIGMSTVVSKDVPPGAIVVGGPSRIVGERDMEQFAELQEQQKLFGILFPDA